jgi:hypothetical protein
VEKLAEAEFFLGQLRQAAGDSFAVRCLFSATANAAYSALEALRAAARRESQFDSWVSARLEALRRDVLANYVLDRRNENTHIGETRVRSARLPIGEGVPDVQHYFRLDPSKTEPVDLDIVAATSHLVNEAAETIYAAMKAFPHHTRAWLLEPARRGEGLSIEDVEARLGFPRGWSNIHGATEEQRLQTLGRTSPPPVLDPRFEALAERFDEYVRSQDGEVRFRTEQAYPHD